MLGRLHHVGIAVASIEAVLESYQSSLNAVAETGIIHDPIQSARVAFLITSAGESTRIELVEPAGEHSPLRRFVDGGGGLHHLCYEVGNIESRSINSARANRLWSADPSPRWRLEAGKLRGS